MALTFRFDEAQLERLITSINDLSANVAKWQGHHATATKQGFSDLVSALGGTSDEQLQAIVDQLAIRLDIDAGEIQTALKQINLKEN